MKPTFRITLSPDEYMLISNFLFPMIVQDIDDADVDIVVKLLGYKSKRSFQKELMKDRRALEPFKILMLLLRANENDEKADWIESLIHSRIVFTNPQVEANVKSFFAIEDAEDENTLSVDELNEMWELSPNE